MTTYDELYSLFVTNGNIEKLMMPKGVGQQYDAIKNAVMLFNNRLRDDVVCDDTSETVDRELTDDEKLIIAHYIKLTLLRNTRTFKNSMFTTFTQEIGVKNINVQLSSLKNDIESQEKLIDMLIFNMQEDTVMEGG